MGKLPRKSANLEIIWIQAILMLYRDHTFVGFWPSLKILVSLFGSDSC